MNVSQEAYNAKRIKKTILDYDRVYPTGVDSIYESIAAAKEEQRLLQLHQRTVDQRSGVINNSEINRRLSMVMPSGLYMILKKKYPTIFSEDYKKFKRDFPVFFTAWKP